METLVAQANYDIPRGVLAFIIKLFFSNFKTSDRLVEAQNIVPNLKIVLTKRTENITFILDLAVAMTNDAKFNPTSKLSQRPSMASLFFHVIAPNSVRTTLTISSRFGVRKLKTQYLF